ncbi:MAG: hypothetical protein ABDI20_04920 [Candidatus Bipolaricaulaceae bacterium]
MLALSCEVTLADGVGFTLDRLATTVFWRVAGFDLDATAAADSTGVQSFVFGAKRDLGFAKLSSKLTFDAAPPAFESFLVAARAEAMGAELGYVFTLGVTDSFQLMTVKYATDTFSVQGKASFGLMPISLREAMLSATWKGCPSCDLSFFSSFLFVRQAGFQYLDIGVKELPLPCCPRFQLLLDVKATFTVDAKEVVPTLRAKLESICADFTPTVALRTDPDVDGISITGLVVTGFTCKVRFAGDVVATYTTTFLEDVEYFETWSLTGPIPACCAASGKWLLALDFRRDPVPATLFGWGRLTLSVELPLLRQLTLSIKGVFKVDAPVWALTFGVKSLW